MNICVINGSPKGEYSVTLQTVLYLEKLFPEHKFSVIHAGQRLRALEKDMSEAVSELEAAELLIFSYPVYTFIAPSQLHSFISLMKASGARLDGKFATQITTSKHFYDVTAHRYIEDNCHDLGLRVIHGLSADMEDLLTPGGQRDADEFFKYVLFCVENGVSEPVPAKASSEAKQPYTSALTPSQKEQGSGFDVAVVADLEEGDESLRAMIADFEAVWPFTVRIVNIADYPFSGGCLGCFNCAGDGKCVYKDGFDVFLREKIQTADAVVCAFTIKDHSMGARFKMYDDRQFCNGHRTVTEGMPFGYLINGDLASEENLRTVIEARAEVGHNFLAGVGTDAETMESLSRRLRYALEHGYVQPRNFYGVGVMKIFRDLIWLMRGLMKADHEFYKKHGIYDFPQKKRGQMLKMLLLGSLVRNPKVKAKLGNRITVGMLAPYRAVIEKDGGKQ